MHLRNPLAGLALLPCLLAGAPAAVAQSAATSPAVPPTVAVPRPSGVAVRTAEPPVIDGMLDEAGWRTAEPLTGFVQADPLEGQPASERTEVRVLYDGNAVYLGVRLHDRNPSEIVITDTRRDSSLSNQDSIKVIFDTFRDRQNGFVFGTNAAGVQYDAQVRNQGGESSSWDGSWDVQTRQDEAGWTAEFRIPLRTLRYGPPPQAWGVNFTRNIQRGREISYWAPMPRQFNLGRLSSAGALDGLELASPRNFKVLPYVVGSANRNFTPGFETRFDGDIGIDAKVGVTPSLNLDLTYNTDFAQVEVDTQQINLTRFNLRFPEKRPFFLENSGMFAVGASASGLTSNGNLDLFFSRRIGLDDGGNLVPILGGARLSGKAGGYNIGVFDMQTDDVAGTPANNFMVARVSRDLPSRSGVGVLFINRTATGGKADSDDWNRTWGLDGRVGIGEHLSVGGFAARTETPGLTGRDHAWNISSEYDDGKTGLDFDYGIVGEDFNPEVGFLENTLGYRRWYARFDRTMRAEWITSRGFREFLPHINYTRFDDLDDGGLQSAALHIDNHWDWENGNFISTGVNGSWEGLDEPFEIFPGVVVPPGEHGGLRFMLRSNTDRRKSVFASYRWEIGRLLTGDQQSHNLSATIRRGGTFALAAAWNIRDIDLPQGDFRTNLGNLRVTYNFTPSVFVQSLIQFNDRSDRWSTNLRFHWLQTAGTGLFVVYNDTESLEGLGPVNRAFIVKYVQQFDLLR